GRPYRTSSFASPAPRTAPPENPCMRKILVIAQREYNAAVRTKAFLLSLVLMPILMGGSIVVQRLFKDLRDTKDKKFAVIDRTPGGQLYPTVEKVVSVYNDNLEDPQTGKKVRPRFLLEREPVDPSESIDELRLKLSDRVRKRELFGFLEIGPD